MVVILLGVMMAFIAGFYVVSQVMVTKIEAQNAADAAALAGAGILADTLDAIAFSQLGKVVACALFGFSGGSAIGRVIDSAVKPLIQIAPALSRARAVELGWRNGAVAVPINKIDLEVGRFSFFFWSWYYDKLAYRSRNSFGNRFVRVVAGVRPDFPIWLEPLLGKGYVARSAPVIGAVSEAAPDGRGLLIPSFGARLADVPGFGPEQELLDHVNKLERDFSQKTK